MNEKLFNIDYLKHLCQKYDLRPSKSYGQNYLINPEVIGVMVEASNVSKKDTIVEVGPGFGVLTFALCENVKKLISFEIEKKLEKYWENNKQENLEIIWGNVLRSAENNFPKNYKVVANLPYQITSPVIKLFLEDLPNKPSEMTLMVQKEVAERICAKPGDMSVLAIAVQYYAEAEIVGEVTKNNFWPEPAVNSAVIKIYLSKHTTDKEYDKKFFKLVKAGFAQKRKLLTKNILPIIGKQNKAKLIELLQKLDFSETVRAQELKISDWQEILKISTLL